MLTAETSEVPGLGSGRLKLAKRQGKAYQNEMETYTVDLASTSPLYLHSIHIEMKRVDSEIPSSAEGTRETLTALPLLHAKGSLSNGNFW